MSTYTPIASQTLGSAAASVTFSSIPQGYTDLVLVWNGTPASDDAITLQFNDDTGSNYSHTRILGDGSSAISQRGSNNTSSIVGLTSSGSINTVIIQIQNYSNSTTYKTLLSRANNTTGYMGAFVSLWRNTNAITKIKVLSAVNYNTGSTFSLYGIQVGDKAQKAQGGNIVTSDGTYMYHAFTTSGSFVPSQAINADVLVVAGGGGGSGFVGAGGGAGGVLAFASQSLTAKNYTCTVGAGGAGNTSDIYAAGNSGNNSQFASLTASVGGGAGGRQSGTPFSGASGGSGGGGTGGTGVSATGGAGTSGQGNAGGQNFTSTNYGGGGGGGAGAVGANGTSTTSGAGGAGVNTVTNWGALSAALTATRLGVSGYIAGGGGAGASQFGGGSTFGAGGSGGGGNGGNGGAGVSGTVSTGSGGGGCGLNAGGPAGGNGDSGIVIIRYAI